jgi:hypothetical protein
MEAARTSRRQFHFLQYSTSQHGEAQNNRLASTTRPSLNVSWVAGCLEGRCLWAIGKPIWLVSVLLRMRATGSLAGDWTAMFRLAAEA